MQHWQRGMTFNQNKTRISALKMLQVFHGNFPGFGSIHVRNNTVINPVCIRTDRIILSHDLMVCQDLAVRLNGARYNIEYRLTGKGIPIIKITRLSDCTFIMAIPCMERPSFYWDGGLTLIQQKALAAYYVIKCGVYDNEKRWRHHNSPALVTI